MKKQILLTTLVFFLAFLSSLRAQNNTRPNIFLPAATAMQVNSYSGSLFYERQDLFIPGRGLDIDIAFSYNSTLDTFDWGYGFGWTHTYNMNYFQKADTFTLMKSDGRRDVFVRNGGNFIASVGVFDKLEEYEPGKLRLTSKSGMRYFFDDAAHKRLTKMEDRNGNTMLLTYAGAQLNAIIDPSGRQISFIWSGGRLSSITDALDTPTRNWTYAYDQQGNLVSVTNPVGNQHLYAYDTGHHMTRATDENSNETAVEYFGSSTAVKTVASCLTRHTFSYNLDQGKSYVTEVVGDGTQVTTYEFDSQGRNMARKGNCCGYETSFQYDAGNNITKTTDGNNNNTTYGFDANGNTTTIADPEGCMVQMTYEPLYNQTASFKDKNGNTTTFAYDNKGNLTTISRPLAVNESYTYDTYGNQISYTDARGNTTTYEYNANGYLTKINHPIGGLNTQFTYDNRGNKLTQTDGNGHTTTFVYDTLNQAVTTQDPLGNQTHYEYDARGNRTRVTNALGNVTEYQYDQLDRLVQMNAPLGTFTRYTYDSRGNRLSETDQRGSTTTYAYDSRNFLISQKDALGYETTYGYDAIGNRIFETDPNGNTTQYFYDKLNRLVKTRDPLGYETQYAFDCNGNTLSVTDANGNATSYTYDALNRQTAMTDALSYTTHFEYDKNNNLTKITDAKGNPTQYQYDALNRKTVETFADNTTKVFTYNGAGNVASRKDNAGNMTYYTYDANNRLTLRDYPDANDDQFTYDALDRMSSATNQNAVVTFTYDALNRMLGETLNGKTTGYAYNNSTGRRTLIYPSGRVIQEYYDKRNQLESIKESNETLASFAYDPGGRMAARNYGNGTVTTYTYDANNRIASIVANPDSFINFRYAYDNVGNKRYEEKRHHATHSEAYGYDANYRLTSFKVGTLVGNDVPAPITQTVYNYDGLGNRTTVVEDGVTTSYTVNEMNELEALNGALSLFFLYDENGNLFNEQGQGYEFNIENKLKQVSGIKIYKYDPFGRKVSEQESDKLSNLYYSGERVIENFKSEGVQTRVYGKVVDDIIKVNSSMVDYFLYYNALNSVGCIMNSEGILLERYEYDAFGTPVFNSPQFNVLMGSIFFNDVLFTGREVDSFCNKFYFRNRFYDSRIGRFISRDPYGYTDGLLSYSYVNNRPTFFNDPYGLKFLPPDMEIGESETCCGKAILSGIDKGDLGAPVCCGGQLVTCVWGAEPKNRTANNISRTCIKVHEDEHRKDEPKCDPCRQEPYRNKSPLNDVSKSECDAYNSELSCLQNKIKECGGDSDCINQINDEIQLVRCRIEKYCYGLNKKCG